jgi:hypothetical protein
MIAVRTANFILLQIAVLGCPFKAVSTQISAAPPINSDQSRISGVWRFQKKWTINFNGDIAVIPGLAYDGIPYLHVRWLRIGGSDTEGRTWNATTPTANQLRESIVEGSSTVRVSSRFHFALGEPFARTTRFYVSRP